jgi:hypothetical protein
MEAFSAFSSEINRPANIAPIAPIDPTPIVTHGESPTAIIRTLA